MNRSHAIFLIGLGLGLGIWTACAVPWRDDRVSSPVSGVLRRDGEAVSSGTIRLVVRSVDNAELGGLLEHDLGPDGRFDFDAVELRVAGHEYSHRYFLLLYWIRGDEAVTLWRADYGRESMGGPIPLVCSLERAPREGPPCRFVGDTRDQPWLLEAGARDYRKLCETCHGAGGKGGSSVVPGQTQPAPDLTRIATRHGGTVPAEEIAIWIDGRDEPTAHGTRQMPVWGDRLGDDFVSGGFTEARIRNRIDILVAYLESIQVESIPRPDAE